MDKPLPRRKQTPLATALLFLTIGVLVVVGLLLPPVSLGKRLFQSDYVLLDSNNPSASHPDGLTIRVGPASLSTGLRLKLGSVPRDQFTPQDAPSDWRAAAIALPSYLLLKSSVYTLDLADGLSTPLEAEISLPPDAKPLVLLDVYAWNGSEWYWVPSKLDSGTGQALTTLIGEPRAIALMGASAQAPVVGMTLNPGEVAPPEVTGLVTELFAGGVSLGNGGIFLGEPSAVGDGDGQYREFLTASATDIAVLQGLLADEALRHSHAQALCDLAISEGYAGVNLDYAGVAAQQGDGFTNLVADLAGRLHGAGLQLVVSVPSPVWSNSGRDVAGYRWTELAAHADRLLVDLPLSPDAYTIGGAVDQLLTWAVSQVDRYQLLVGVNVLGVQKVGDLYRPVDVDEALAALNSALERTHGGGDELSPGREIVVGLASGLVVEDSDAGAYRIDFSTVDGQVTAWLPDEAALTKKLWVVNSYHLGGVVLDGLAGSEMVGELSAAVKSFYLAAKELPLDTSQTLLAWAVQNEAGDPVGQAVGDLSNPQFTWPAANAAGTYTIRGRLEIGRHVADLGIVQVVVVAPTRVPTAVPTERPEATATPMEVAEAEAAPVPNLDADAVVSGELLNVRQGPDTAFAQVGQLVAGTPLQVLAANPDGTWIRVQAADGTAGWVYAGLCIVNISLADVPVEEVEAPTPAPATPTPEGYSAPPPVAPPSSGGGFELGGQVNGYASRPDLMGQAGMNWIKLQAHHGQDMSGAIGGAHGQGFKILLSVIGDKNLVMTDSYQRSYAAYVAQLAAQGADAIEIWNEANLDREWPRDQIDPAAYTRLLAYSYNAIKGSNSGTLVVSGAPAPTGAEAAFPGQVMNDDTWLRGVVNAGGVSYMDCVGVHYNEGTVSPTAWTGATQGDNYYTRYYGGMVNTYWSITGGARPLCFTELGYLSPEGYGTLPSNFAWAASTTVAQQAQWLGEAVSLGRGSGQVRLMIVFNVDFTQWLPTDPQAGYAIIRPGGVCPACATMGAAMGR